MIYEGFIIEDDEFEQFKKLIEQKKNIKKPISLCFGLTYLTPNYKAIKVFEMITNLLINFPDLDIHIILSDTNALNQDYLKDLGIINKDFNSSLFIENKINEIKRIMVSFGCKPEQLHIYRFSEVWSKITKEDITLFLKYYSAISKINLSDLDIKEIKTFANLFRFSLDVYLASSLHILFPDEINSQIDLFCGRSDLKELYLIMRNLLYEGGLTKINKPYFLFIPRYSNLMHNSRMPEWDMSFEEIYYIVDNCKLNKKDFLDIYNLYSSDKNKEISNINNDEIKKMVSQLIFNYLQSMKNKSKLTSLINSNLNISSKEELSKIARILNKKYVIDILKLANGEYSVSRISKMLKIQLSNLSSLVSELKKEKLVVLTKDKKIKKNYNLIKFNFEKLY